MAIEIKELVIRAVAVEKKEEPNQNAEKPPINEEDVEAIIERCVKKVLKILERKNAK